MHRCMQVDDVTGGYGFFIFLSDGKEANNLPHAPPRFFFLLPWVQPSFYVLSL